MLALQREHEPARRGAPACHSAGVLASVPVRVRQARAVMAWNRSFLHCPKALARRGGYGLGGVARVAGGAPRPAGGRQVFMSQYVMVTVPGDGGRPSRHWNLALTLRRTRSRHDSDSDSAELNTSMTRRPTVCLGEVPEPHGALQPA